MAIEDYVQLSDPRECINCGEKVWKTLDVSDLEEFWATDTGNVFCGRSDKRHVPMEY